MCNRKTIDKSMKPKYFLQKINKKYQAILTKQKKPPKQNKDPNY